MNILLIAFFLYLLSGIVFVVSITGSKWRSQKKDFGARLGTFGFILAILGVICQTIFVIYRMIISGYFPTSNMFEFMSFLGYCIALSFLLIYWIYKVRAIGAISMPIVVILIAYASVFPTEVQPLIPALQSHWLYIHVSLAALGNGLFGLGFASGLVFLINTVDRKNDRRSAFWLEVIFVILVMLLAFIALTFIFSAIGYHAEYEYVARAGTSQEHIARDTYVLPPIFIHSNSKVIETQPFLGMEMGWFETPTWMKGANAAKKFNSVVWSVVVGGAVYGLIRLIIRRRLSEAIKPITKGINPEMAEEISYRAVAIAYPIYTLGALIFAMIWAHEAWGRFWGWDPKEVWALITWLFYSAYLHLRLSRGWQGKRSAWLAVGGFAIVMINLIVVNLVVAGLHSYA